MKIHRSNQNLLPKGVKTTVTSSSVLRDGTEIKLTVSKIFETRFDSNEWYLLKRERIRIALLKLEDECCKRVVKHLKVTQLRKRLFSDT
jgi:hypothetical protein